jgi:hypothetical protein
MMDFHIINVFSENNVDYRADFEAGGIINHTTHNPLCRDKNNR